MLFTENAANSSLDRSAGQSPLQNRAKNDALRPASPCGHHFCPDFCPAQRDRGINHACDAIGSLVVFLFDLVFFIRWLAMPRAKSDVSPM
jgi:hypothetical protein